MKNKKIYIFLLAFLMLFLNGCISFGSFELTFGDLEKTMYVGDKIYLSTNLGSSDENSDVEWISSDEAVATVSEEGLVEALSSGTVQITATYDSYSCHVTITVLDNSKNDVIEISGMQTVVIGESTTLVATCNNSNATLVWESSDESIATVEQTGKITGIKPGVVTIKVYLEDDNNVYDELVILVRTGSGMQDVIMNYINQNIYITSGNYDLTSLNEIVVNMISSVEEAVIGVANYSGSTGGTLAGTGTGGIYKKEKIATGFKYTVFTNYHVIEDATVVKVYLGDLDEYVVANVVKSDENLDLAVLTFEHTKEYQPLVLGNNDSVNNGDFVVAIGNPGGFTYYGSATFGMVSCYNRLLEDSNVVYVQHDTPINPGNSGGPLFNLKGEVVGINTLKLASSEIEGMGFSIACETFLEYLN